MSTAFSGSARGRRGVALWLAGAAGAVLLSHAAAARADEPPPFSAPPAPPRTVWIDDESSSADRVKPAPAKPGRVWYGWETLIGLGVSDASLATSFALFGAGNTNVTFVFMVTGIAGHVFSGPIVHWSRGHTARSFASLAMNVGITGAGIGGGFLAIAAATHGSRSSDGAAIGAVIFPAFLGAFGALAAHTIDIAALSYDEPKRKAGVASLQLAPIVAPHTGGLAIGGAF